MAENFPNLVKETDIQVQEHKQSQTRWIQETHTKTYCD